MLAPLHKVGIQIMETGFSFMAPMPVEWDKNAGLITCMKSERDLTKFIITINMAGLMFLGYVYAIITEGIKPRFGLDVTMVGLLATGILLLGLAWLLCLTAAKSQGFVLALNTFFKISKRASTCKSKYLYNKLDKQLNI